MAGTIDPSARPSLLTRLLPGPVRSVGRNLWGTFRFAPWPVKIMIALVFVVGPSAAFYQLAVRKVRNARQQQQVGEWKAFEDATRQGDEAKMMAALDRVLLLVPDDRIALGRKRALETGEADPDDQPMVILNIRRLLRANKLADAEREARKRLAAEKSDWLARCVVAAAHLQRGDRAAAVAELDQLPDPGNANARLDPGGLLFAYKLFRAAGKEPAQLRQFTQGVILPVLKSPGAALLPAAEKVGLVECYAESFDPAAPGRQPANLVEAWAVAAKLLDAATDDAIESKDTAVLVRIGRVGGLLEGGLAGLRRGEQVTTAEHTLLLSDLRDRSRRVWEGVRTLSPTNTEAYRGLAVLQLRAIDAAPPADRPKLYEQARATLVQGIQTRTDDPELVQLFTRLLAVEGRPLQATQLLVGLAREHPDKPVWWALAAESAIAANRRDVALDACAQLRAKDPNNPWALRTQARLWVDAGRSADALPLLARLGDDVLKADPLAAYPYARALAETQAMDKLAGYIQAVAGAEQPGVAGAVARGLAEATGLSPADVLARTAVLAERYADQSDLLRARATAAYQAAEMGEPLWDVGRVSAAVQATEQALLKLPGDPDLLTQLGWLRLSGQRSAPQAARAVAPLRALDAKLTPRQLELLGAVALAENDLPAATRHLTRATRASDPPAGAFALLAQVHHASGQPAAARAALDAARARPRSPREQASYLVVAKLVAP